ncbi:MAG TPA: MauE/DoxX family redox-associated membrane protein [Acidimicrobiales bacterium]|nr:MauE/DoxX family redox-associated membrane protein [Acidimicrobiales bacterium]
MDLNRAAVLVAVAAVLAPAAAGHAVRLGALATAIRGQGVLPVARSRSAATGWAAAVVALELVVVASVPLAWAAGTTRLAGLLAAATGLAFVAYVATLRRRGYAGDCGCSPVASAVTGLSFVPGAFLVAGGAVLALDRSSEVAFAQASGTLEPALALGASALLGALVLLLPASALAGDPTGFRQAS